MNTTSRADKHHHTHEEAGTASTTRLEIGFAEFPVVAASLKRPVISKKSPDTLEFMECIGHDPSGEPIHRGWQVVGSSEYGLPRLPDLDLFVAILKLLEQQNYDKKLVLCNAKDICDIVGLSRGGETYRRLRDAFIRFQTTSYVAKNIFIEPKTSQRVLSEGFSIIADHRLLPDHKKDEATDGLPPSYFAVSAAFLNRLRTGKLKPIDLTLWRQLPLGLEKPLYHVLDKSLWGETEAYEIGLCRLTRKLGVTGNYYPSQLQRLYRKPLSNLVQLGFLRDFRFEKTKLQDDRVKVIVFPGSRARTHTRKRSEASAPQETEKPTAGGRITRNSAPSEADALVSYFSLNQFGIEKTRATSREREAARQILSLAGDDQEKAHFVIRYALQDAKRTNFEMRSIAGVLTNSYAERALAQYDQEQKREAHARTQAEEARFEVEYRQWYEDELDRRWQAMGREVQEAGIKAADQHLEERIGAQGMNRMSPTARRNTAERLARGKLGDNLPSFQDWLGQRQEAKNTPGLAV